MNIIGRSAQQALLDAMLQSDKAELLALYGRRRVGKTHLIRTHFLDKDDIAFFYVTGMKDGPMHEQITNFTEVIGDKFLYPGARLEIKKNWRDTFRTLTDNINATPENKKIVLFFDEFPWMVSRNSRLLQTFEYFWNQYWSANNRIKLIICGSSSGWILKNIVNNKGGLYNRVTRTIHLEPFNLHKTELFLKHLKIKLNRKQIAQVYMVLGGIPFYLSQIDPGQSANQIIEKLAFGKESFLMKEFENLYATLFGTKGGHITLAREIAKHHYGLEQNELIKKADKLSSGGRIKVWLTELEQAGFIIRFVPFKHKKKGIYFKMIDEYSLFYFNWIEPIKNSLLERGMLKGYWEQLQQTPTWKTWMGYAFETTCFKHLPQISHALDLNAMAIPYVWRCAPSKDGKTLGAQIDLLFDRNDGTITIVEIKNTSSPVVINKEMVQKLKQRINTFIAVTRTKKQIHVAIISAAGIKETSYAEDFLDGAATLNELFQEESD